MKQLGVVGPNGFRGVIDVTEQVSCARCDELLGVNPDPSSDRQPCPKCGSTDRKFAIVMTEAVTISDELVRILFRTPIALQTVVIRGDTTDEGAIIEAVALPWFDIIEQIKADPLRAHELPARMWEEIVAGAYKRAGFDEVVLTPRSGDRGRDVIATKRGIGTVRVIDQVKAFKPGHLVDADDVRALMGVLANDGASKGFLTTTSDFAPKLRDDPLIKPWIPSRLELVNGVALLNRLRALAK
jgi:restriction system protein